MAKPKTDDLIQILTGLAGQVGVEVRCEVLKGIGGMPVASGLAKVDDNWVIFLEKRQPARHRLDVLIDSLQGFDLSSADIPDQVRPYFPVSA